jgi:hypothetical protein
MYNYFFVVLRFLSMPLLGDITETSIALACCFYTIKNSRFEIVKLLNVT